VGALLGDKWRGLSEEDKAPWVEAATEDKARYADELTEYTPPPTAAANPAAIAKPPAKKPKPSGSSAPEKRSADATKRGSSAAAALRKAARAPDAGSKSRKKKSDDGDSSEDEKDRAPSHGTATLRVPAFPPAEKPPPALDESIILPKARAPMRSIKLEPGVRIAWFPQPYKKFEEHYAKTLEELQVIRPS
jgi:hypothetical protein